MIVCGAAASYCAMAVFHSSGSASGVSGTCQALQTQINQQCCQFLCPYPMFPTATVTSVALNPYQRILHSTRRCEAAHALICMRRSWVIRGVPRFTDALLTNAPNVTLGRQVFPLSQMYTETHAKSYTKRFSRQYADTPANHEFQHSDAHCVLVSHPWPF